MSSDLPNDAAVAAVADVADVADAAVAAETVEAADTNADDAVRVATYNVLLTELASAAYHVHCKPRALETPARMKRLCAKLAP